MQPSEAIFLRRSVAARIACVVALCEKIVVLSSTNPQAHGPAIFLLFRMAALQAGSDWAIFFALSHGRLASGV